MLTYDQTSEIRVAFEEAFIEPGRRRAIRYKQRVDVLLRPCRGHAVDTPINVSVEDFSSCGIGIVCFRALELGSNYMLRVPRQGQDDLEVIFTVVRLSQLDSSSYSIGLEATDVAEPGKPLDVQVDKYMNSLMSRRTKILFLLFGIVSLATCVHLSVL